MSETIELMEEQKILSKELGEINKEIELLEEEQNMLREEREQLDKEADKHSEEWIHRNEEWHKRREELGKGIAEYKKSVDEYNNREEEYNKLVKADTAKKEYETILKKRAINKLFNTFLVLSGSLWGSVLLFSAYKSGVGVWFFVGLFVCYLLGKAFLEINVKEDDSYNAFRLRMITFLNGWVAGHVAVYALLAFGRGSLNNDALVVFGLYSLIFLANFWFSSQYKKILKIKPWSKELRG